MIGNSTWFCVAFDVDCSSVNISWPRAPFDVCLRNSSSKALRKLLHSSSSQRLPSFKCWSFVHLAITSTNCIM